MICFVHIEKAAGTTLHYIFRNNDLSYLALHAWYTWSNTDDCVFTKEEAKCFFKILPFTKGFGGHTTRSYLKYEKVITHDMDYITFLREPIARYISHYRHQKQKMTMGCIEEFLNEKRFNNFMTKRIAGNFDVDQAKRILLEDFSFVGLTERFDESLILMKKKLRLERFCLFYEKKRVSAKTQNIEDDTTNINSKLDKIYENNKLDIELYNFAKNNIYKKYIESFDNNLEKEVENHKNINKDFRFSKIRHITWAAYRYLVYKNIEFILQRIFH